MEVVAEKEVADDLAGTAEFLPTPPQTGVGDCQVNEFQEPMERRSLAHRIAVAACPKRSRHLAAGIAQLVHERHRVPAASREVGVQGHG